MIVVSHDTLLLSFRISPLNTPYIIYTKNYTINSHSLEFVNVTHAATHIMPYETNVKVTQEVIGTTHHHRIASSLASRSSPTLPRR